MYSGINFAVKESLSQYPDFGYITKGTIEMASHKTLTLEGPISICMRPTEPDPQYRSSMKRTLFDINEAEYLVV